MFCNKGGENQSQTNFEKDTLNDVVKQMETREETKRGRGTEAKVRLLAYSDTLQELSICFNVFTKLEFR